MGRWLKKARHLKTSLACLRISSPIFVHPSRSSRVLICVVSHNISFCTSPLTRVVIIQKTFETEFDARLDACLQVKDAPYIFGMCTRDLILSITTFGSPSCPTKLERNRRETRVERISHNNLFSPYETDFGSTVPQYTVAVMFKE